MVSPGRISTSRSSTLDRRREGRSEAGWCRITYRADQSSRVQAVCSYFGPTDLCEKTWSKELEEKVLALQNTKRDLADAILNADNSLIRNLTKEDLELLLS